MRGIPQWERKELAVCVDFDDGIIAYTIGQNSFGFKDTPIKQLDVDIF